MNREETTSSKDRMATDAGVVFATTETVQRGGSANAEFIKGYTGRDNETGKVFAKSLEGISKYKVNPDWSENNIKQQAGFSAEVAATSRDNASDIMSGSKERTSRSDDLEQYVSNHPVVDRVKILSGKVIDGTETQMKFVGDRDQLFERIAKEDGKFARYRGGKIELPSEQVEGAKEYCLEKAQKLRNNGITAENSGRPAEVVAKLRKEADNYEQLSNDIRDAGLTTEDAIFYRNHPKIATLLDIGRTSHQAGTEGAKIGATVAAVVSIFQNAFAVAQDKKSLGGAAEDVARSTVKAAALGYGTAFTGSFIKGTMQQSTYSTARQLAKTSVPVIALNVCLSLGKCITRYVQGDINETELLEQVGEQGANMLSSSMMAALGQVAIPIPVVGAAIGGMIGYTLSSMFYQSALEVGRQSDAAQENLLRIKEIEAAARALIAVEREALAAFMRKELPALETETQQLISMLESPQTNQMDDFANAINRYATLLGKELEFKTIQEFNAFMAESQPLCL